MNHKNDNGIDTIPHNTKSIATISIVLSPLLSPYLVLVKNGRQNAIHPIKIKANPNEKYFAKNEISAKSFVKYSYKYSPTKHNTSTAKTKIIILE